MGFCLFSNVAIAARAAQAAGLQRVAIVDFDVHHGNGTQAVFEADPDLFFASIHQCAHLARHRRSVGDRRRQYRQRHGRARRRRASAGGRPSRA